LHVVGHLEEQPSHRKAIERVGLLEDRRKRGRALLDSGESEKLL
jgi:hypothetical protein